MRVIKEPKRILQIINALDIDSGTVSVVMNLYRNVDRSEIQFDFLICKRINRELNSLEKEIAAMGGKIFFFNLSILSFCKTLCGLKKFFKVNSGKYLAVHLHTPSLCEFTLKYAKKYGWRNRIVHSHSSMMSPSLIKNFIHKFLLRNITAYANNFWACSTEAANFLYGKSIGKVEIMKNAVDVKRFCYKVDKSFNLKKSFGLDNKIVILHVSNFAPIKNLLFFTDVMRFVENEKIRYVFVGTGKTFNDVKKKVQKYGLEKKCLFVGKSNEVEKYLSMADAFVLPSIKEGLPVTVIEAQACGVPCYISDSITQEANAGLVHYIKHNRFDWIKQIAGIDFLQDCLRKRNCEIFKHTRFNLEKESRRIQNIYLAMEQ